MTCLVIFPVIRCTTCHTNLVTQVDDAAVATGGIGNAVFAPLLRALNLTLPTPGLFECAPVERYTMDGGVRGCMSARLVEGL